MSSVLTNEERDQLFAFKEQIFKLLGEITVAVELAGLPMRKIGEDEFWLSDVQQKDIVKAAEARVNEIKSIADQLKAYVKNITNKWV